MTAGGADVLALAVADHNGVMMLGQQFLELADPDGIRALEIAARVLVERDQVDFGSDGSQQFNQSLGVGHAVVDAFHQDVFKCNLSPGRQGITSAGRQQVGDWLISVDGLVGFECFLVC